ncbi:MAG: AI-2E family transporter [Candidatus Obscuribacterales bacterium]|nr:AI-2E family transporter [Candidatus Obscuribacterales bacterium]
MLKWLATFVLIWFIYQVRHVFPPIIVGAIIAYLLLPVVQQLKLKAKMPLGVATAVVFLSLLGALILLIWMIGPHLMRELKDLADPASQRQIIFGAVTQIGQGLHWQSDSNVITNNILKNLNESFGKPEEIMHIGGLLSHGALSVLVCVVSSIYFTLDSQAVGRFFLRYVPERRKGAVIELFEQMNKMLSNYVRGQIFLIVIMSVVAWLFLHFAINMKYALPVAILSGFLEIIPVLGPILATSTATLVGMSQFGPGVGLAIIVFYTVARWLEDYVVVPKVIGHAVELHPLAVIFAVLCGETLAGALGMLIAIPVAACVKLVLDFFYLGRLPLKEKIAVEVAQKVGEHLDPTAVGPDTTIDNENK